MLYLALKCFDTEILKCFQLSPEPGTFLFSLKAPAYPSYFLFAQFFPVPFHQLFLALETWIFKATGLFFID